MKSKVKIMSLAIAGAIMVSGVALAFAETGSKSASKNSSKESTKPNHSEQVKKDKEDKDGPSSIKNLVSVAAKEGIKSPGKVKQIVKSASVKDEDENGNFIEVEKPSLSNLRDYSNYSLVDASATKQEGTANTYYLRAVLMDKTTGQQRVVETTTQLSEEMKDTLRQIASQYK